MASQPLKITLLGSGNVATHFGKAFRDAGAEIVQVYSPTAAHAKKLAKALNAKATSDITEILPGAGLYLVAVKDDALPGLVKKLAVKKGIVAHTAGSVPLDVLKKFPQSGVLYPLQTFSKKRKVKASQVPLCIEASDAKTLRELEKIAQSLSKKTYRLDSTQRRAAHLAAVFACNFTNHLYAVAAALLEEQRLPFALIRPLILETAKKTRSLSPAEAQTGPALRNDDAVMKKHIALLKKHPAWKTLYATLSSDIQTLAGKKKK